MTFLGRYKTYHVYKCTISYLNLFSTTCQLLFLIKGILYFWEFLKICNVNFFQKWWKYQPINQNFGKPNKDIQKSSWQVVTFMSSSDHAKFEVNTLKIGWKKSLKRLIHKMKAKKGGESSLKFKNKIPLIMIFLKYEN